jgi:two-component system phosphate regulon response regulator PhoB
MKGSVLIADDERDVTRLVGKNLKSAGFTVSEVTHGDNVVARVLAELPTLIILDIMLPGLSGFEVCRLLKSDPRTNRIPIILLTAKALERDRIHGLELGADDYVTKPFSPRELVLRVKAQVRKFQGHRESGDVTQVGEIVLDKTEHAVRVAGRSLELTPTEFKLLSIFMERCGRVQSRDRLLTDVWGYESAIESRTVDIHVTRLREKLGPAAPHLETVRGFGYRMIESPPE